MFLKRIEIQGFKSFADKSIVTFDSDITGVVGPNGCGKSNINDAIRWVLGEQSVKSLRGNSMTDVIFNGSVHRKPVNMAEVTLVFDNVNHYLNIEFEEVEITRKLHRATGEGEYFINKTPCRLKDIHNLIMDSGLGRDSLSIISQGNISSFAEAKPEERRALFEEAAGVAKYKKRKNESLSKLQRTQENLQRVHDIIEELDGRVQPLKRQAKKAEKYIVLKEELETIEVSVLVDDIEQYQTQFDDYKKRQFDMSASQLMMEASIQTQDEENLELSKEASVLDNEIQNLTMQQRQLFEEKNAFDKRKVEQEEKRKYAIEYADAKAKAKELKAMLDIAKMEYDDRLKRLKDAKTQETLAIKNLEQVRNDMAYSQQDYEKARGVFDHLNNRKGVLENMIKSPFLHQRGVKSIMDAKSSLAGIHGVVSQLLKPHENYELAISNALGGSSYHIIASDEASSRHAISYLKKNASGVATFLPLTVLKPRYIRQDDAIVAENLVGYLGVASDFVSYDSSYDVLAKSLLGNVLVVDTLAHANELAKTLRYQYKCITLDGDIVHRGGSMTGGKDNSRQTTPITIEKELRQVLADLEGQQMQLDSCRTSYQTMQSKYERTESLVKQAQLQIAGLQPVVSAKQARFESLKIDYEQIKPDDEEENAFEEDELVKKLNEIHSKIDEVDATLATKRERRSDIGLRMERKQQQLRKLRVELNDLQRDSHMLIDVLGRTEVKLENALERLRTTYEMTYEGALEHCVDINMDEAKERVAELRRDIATLGNVNLDAPGEYEEVRVRFDFLTTQKEELETASQQILEAIDEMDDLMKTQFLEMFHKINNELEGVFQALFGGGKARLFMVDPEDVLNTGIDIEVHPPGKIVQNIRLFSGGEKSLIAISVLFAILKARTMPLCIFDEVEAALDQANVERFARYIGNFRGESQFIVVTHRPGTMVQCDTLYGVTMQQNGVSQLLSVKLQEAMQLIDETGEGA